MTLVADTCMLASYVRFSLPSGVNLTDEETDALGSKFGARGQEESINYVDFYKFLQVRRRRE
jgi:hypothetical protein